MGLSALAHVTDLFVEGKELVIRPLPEAEDGPPAVLVWVNKLNTFERDEARRAAAVARARTILAIREQGNPEKVLYDANVAALDPAGLREALLDVKVQERRMKALNAVRVDPEWAERYGIALEGKGDNLPPEELGTIVKAQQDLLDEMDRRSQQYRDDEERDLLALDEATLREKHLDAWLETQGMNSFGTELRRQQVFHALRACQATKKVDDHWDHSECDHSKRLCDTPAEVDRVPDTLIDGTLALLNALTVPDDDARFSAEAEVSSAPSPSSEKAEESARSGQEVTSDVPVPTS